MSFVNVMYTPFLSKMVYKRIKGWTSAKRSLRDYNFFECPLKQQAHAYLIAEVTVTENCMCENAYSPDQARFISLFQLLGTNFTLKFEMARGVGSDRVNQFILILL